MLLAAGWLGKRGNSLVHSPSPKPIRTGIFNCIEKTTQGIYYYHKEKTCCDSVRMNRKRNEIAWDLFQVNTNGVKLKWVMN